MCHRNIVPAAFLIGAGLGLLLSLLFSSTLSFIAGIFAAFLGVILLRK